MRYFSEDWLPLRDEAGKIIAFNVAIVETTEQKQAQENILKKQKQLGNAKRALERSKGNFTWHLKMEKSGCGNWIWAPMYLQ
jgi:hypothetical protein